MPFKIIDLGLIDFISAFKLQDKIHNLVSEGSLSHTMIICRHYPVITVGRRYSLNNLKAQFSELASRGVSFCQADRGGDITYHGPGQLLLYPIFDLKKLRKDLHWFLRAIEDLVIGVLGDFGISAEKRPGLSGVWIGQKKVSSIGIAVKNWVTYHGAALNIKRGDLDNFSLINPCGMPIEMTSMESALKRDILIKEVKTILERRSEDAKSDFA